MSKHRLTYDGITNVSRVHLEVTYRLNIYTNVQVTDNMGSSLFKSIFTIQYTYIHDQCLIFKVLLNLHVPYNNSN